MNLTPTHQSLAGVVAAAMVAVTTVVALQIAGIAVAGTIDNQYSATGAVAAGSTTMLRVTGRGGVPANARAVSINLTATNPDTAGYATVYPCGEARPEASNLNFTPGSTVANAVLTKVGTDGNICIYTDARINLIADVNGAFTTDALTSVNPARLIDTRPGTRTIDNQYSATGAVAAGSTTMLRVTGRGGVPANARAVSINLTATNPDTAGYATVYPCGEARPEASNLNFTPGSTVANAVLTKVGTDGNICIYTDARINLIADVNGAFTTDALTSVNPARLIDTRGAPAAPAAPAAHGSNGIAIDASAIPAPATGFSGSQIGTAQYAPQSGDGAFRTNCRISHMNFDDPIVFPGQRSATHLHAFFGHTGVDAFSTASSIAGSGNSTCNGGTINRSAYWAPGVVDVDTMRPVTPVGEHALQAYYKVGYQGVAPSQIQNMTAGLRMVAGDARSTQPQERQGPGQPRPVTYYCVLGASGAMTTEQTSFPDCAPGQIFVMKIVFPQCWDGVNLDSADHKSHMSYGTWGPVPGQNGAGCPQSHPVAIPEITQNFRYLVPQGGMSSWRLASDTYSGPAGHSGHADWWNGWDHAVFQRVVDNCLRQNIDCQMNLLGDGQVLN